MELKTEKDWIEFLDKNSEKEECVWHRYEDKTNIVGYKKSFRDLCEENKLFFVLAYVYVNPKPEKFEANIVAKIMNDEERFKNPINFIEEHIYREAHFCIYKNKLYEIQNSKYNDFFEIDEDYRAMPVEKLIKDGNPYIFVIDKFTHFFETREEAEEFAKSYKESEEAKNELHKKIDKEIKNIDKEINKAEKRIRDLSKVRDKLLKVSL